MVDRWAMDLDFKTVRFLCLIPAHSTWQVNKLNEAIQSNLSEPSTSEHLLIQILKNQEERTKGNPKSSLFLADKYVKK